MRDHFYALPGALTAHFRTACTIGTHEAMQLEAYVPGITPLSIRPHNRDISLEHVMGDTPSFEDQGTHVKLCTARSNTCPLDIYHLLYGLTRRTLLAQNLYSVHAACVGESDNYTLMIGHSGAGKTTLAQKCVTQAGYTLFSGNKTVVKISDNGEITAIAGTKTMTALDAQFKRHAYIMQPHEYAQTPAVKITSIAIIRINDGVAETQRLTGLAALHTLYPYFMDTVNADVIVNGRHVFDGTPPHTAKAALVSSLGKAINQIPVHKYAGSMTFLKQRVIKP